MHINILCAAIHSAFLQGRRPRDVRNQSLASTPAAVQLKRHFTTAAMIAEHVEEFLNCQTIALH